MKHLLAIVGIGLALGSAVPAWAQANGGLNPCLKNVHVDGGGNGLIFGGHASTDVPVSDDDCWRLQRANLAALLAVNSHDPVTQREWSDAARGVWCAIPDNRMNAPQLCSSSVAPMVRADPPPTQPSVAGPVSVATVPQVAQSSTAVPLSAQAPTTPVQVAILTDSSTPSKPCRIPDGVPASQWSGCWYNK